MSDTKEVTQAERDAYAAGREAGFMEASYHQYGAGYEAGLKDGYDKGRDDAVMAQIARQLKALSVAHEFAGMLSEHRKFTGFYL